MTDTTEMDLFVHAALPKGKRHYTTRLPGYPKEVQIQGIIYHFCPSCKGWIEGESEAKRVKKLNPRLRSGRRGIDYSCRRCNHYLGFVGIRS